MYALTLRPVGKYRAPAAASATALDIPQLPTQR